MCQLLETINLTDGQLQNMEFHNRRFIKSFRECFGYDPRISLKDAIIVPPEFTKGIYRCRISYNDKDFNVEFLPYEFRKIESLQMVVDDTLDYHLKFAGRTRLDALYQKKDNCDDIIIVSKGLITDSFAANLVFFDGSNWFTPDKPLLHGTMRANLLSKGLITESHISATNYGKFMSVGLINAFLSLENMPVIPICRIMTI